MQGEEIPYTLPSSYKMTHLPEQQLGYWVCLLKKQGFCLLKDICLMFEDW